MPEIAWVVVCISGFEMPTCMYMYANLPALYIVRVSLYIVVLLN